MLVSDTAIDRLSAHTSESDLARRETYSFASASRPHFQISSFESTRNNLANNLRSPVFQEQELIPNNIMFNNKITALCLAVVALSSGTYAEQEAAQTFGLLGAGVYGGVGANVYGNRAGWYGPGVGVGVGGVGVGVGLGGVGVGVGGVGVDAYDAYDGVGVADAGVNRGAVANGGATASASATANAGTTRQYRKLRTE